MIVVSLLIDIYARGWMECSPSLSFISRVNAHAYITLRRHSLGSSCLGYSLSWIWKLATVISQDIHLEEYVSLAQRLPERASLRFASLTNRSSDSSSYIPRTGYCVPSSYSRSWHILPDNISTFTAYYSIIRTITEYYYTYYQSTTRSTPLHLLSYQSSPMNQNHIIPSHRNLTPHSLTNPLPILPSSRLSQSAQPRNHTFSPHPSHPIPTAYAHTTRFMFQLKPLSLHTFTHT